MNWFETLVVVVLTLILALVVSAVIVEIRCGNALRVCLSMMGETP